MKAMLVYREVGYPVHDDAGSRSRSIRTIRGGNQAFAFAYGYIRALIQAMAYIA